MRAGLEGLIAAMKDRRPAPDRGEPGSEASSQSSEESDDVACGARGSALASGAAVGRYMVLEKLGAGAMGVVYAAYDPELDRKVALKLLLPGLGGDERRERLRREAQALAKLADPNIVAIHDVGTVGEQVWLAMEFLQGRTLGAWLAQQPRGWREVVRAMRSAGKGLAAAHAAGLLHRDFKPENVMVGDDGRVRVMDFGLARVGPEGMVSETDESRPQPTVGTLALQLTAAGATMGTPAYMAPEQFEPAEITAAADQFAFCVTLWEALYGKRPFAGRTLGELAANVLAGRRRPPPKDRGVPNRLRLACERGLSVDPRERWPSMAALMAELGRLAAPRTRRWLALGVTGGLAALGGGLALARYVEVMDRCTGAQAQLDGIWDAAKRQEVKAAILDTALVYAPGTWERVEPRLDDYAEAWASKHTEVCEATRVTAEQTEAAMELRMGCLRERRTAFDAAVKVLAAADENVVEKAVGLVAGLPMPTVCDDVELLERQRQRVPPPEDPQVARQVEALRDQLAGVDAEDAAGKYAHALQQLERLLPQVEALGYPPLLAEATFRHGDLLAEAGKYGEAEQELQAAYALAVQHEHDEVALDAAQLLIFVVGDRQARHAESLVWGQTALPLAEGRGGDVELATSLSHVGVVLGARGEYERAERHLRRALQIREEALGADDLATTTTLNNLGNVLKRRGEYEQAEIHYRRALQIREKALGPDHPDVAHSVNNLGLLFKLQGNYAQAEAHLRRALQILEKALGPEHPEVAHVSNNLGNLFKSQGNYEQAEVQLQRALQLREAAFGADHPDVANSSNDLGLVFHGQGKYEQAKLHLQRASQIWERALGPEHPDLAKGLNNIGSVLYIQGDYEQAEIYFQRVLRIYEKSLGPNHSDVADVANNLGSVSHARGDYEQATLQHERALRIRESVLGPDHPDVATSLENLGSALAGQGPGVARRAPREVGGTNRPPRRPEAAGR
jgi:tetratricopeptide (TPR) repeat protein/predicted Ser/Thr protein kinase